ncbi:MAG TPA: YfcE family phosphodiesterase [Anaerolineales bacterium]|jgi:putative phosphoesterase|nr:YfcE family phosphodiesterase [Anaerolineales bacterium]|tara:strand:- start:99 stop:593 length:495 start_codon:yes stop_codon:yes gene_type:complete
MKLAVLSDTHDNIPKLEAALRMMAEADAVLHCGDLCSPFVVERIAMGLPDITPVHIIWGNNEGDIRLICAKAAQHDNINLHGDFAVLMFDGKNIALTHYPEIARPLASSGNYKLVCYGHDHCAYHSQLTDCTLLNPGELLGLKGKTTFAWFDTTTEVVRFVEIK